MPRKAGRMLWIWCGLLLVVGSTCGWPTVQVHAADAPHALRGSQPWVTILCRFADLTTFTPHPRSYYETLMGSTEPGMDHYWREVSYNTINLNGSIVVGWYDLPHPQAYYQQGDPNEQSARLASDCTAVADPHVVFANFVGVNLVFNDSVGFPQGTPYYGVVVDGAFRQFRMTWLSGSDPQAAFAHEMGHGFGLPHSSGPYDRTYDSQWDLMSDGSTCRGSNTAYGCIAVHTIAYHKDLLGWIPVTNKYLVNASGTQRLTITQLATPAPAGAYLLAQIPINGSATQFYTVEARRWVGYDRRVPGEAIVIHKVDTMRGERTAQVVDSDNNGDPNDAGAMWLPGETFRDAANNITITVEQATPTGFVVAITSTQPSCVDTAYEPDNTQAQARLFVVGSTERHALCTALDEDWVKFDAVAGTTYRIETLNLSSGTNTFLELYADRIISDDNSNGGNADLIIFTPTRTGTYWVVARQVGGGGSTTFAYDLRITAAGPPSQLQPRVRIPLITR